MTFSTRLISLGVLAFFAFNFPITSMANELGVIEIPKDEQTLATLKNGHYLIIKIASNPSTGYRWELKGLNELKQCLRIKEEAYETPTSSGHRVGAVGYQRWKIKSKCVAGNAELLRFEYARSWDNLPPVSWAELLIDLKP